MRKRRLKTPTKTQSQIKLQMIMTINNFTKKGFSQNDDWSFFYDRLGLEAAAGQRKAEATVQVMRDKTKTWSGMVLAT
ncbi:hypothetical protein GCM10008986_34700 [Salinibacillus aidingensis]|uniref:Uncharacterized protein n=1 Tax=Salinibacillus aidingensis TaxID=237684 RepID=A0ABP3LN55_9BACI